ncbi:MAG TPA: hypothetical protein VFB04_07865, partial [Terriglobales bacterium]|nr:hypothetical protein [Terriglobales bacterium]
NHRDNGILDQILTAFFLVQGLQQTHHCRLLSGSFSFVVRYRLRLASGRRLTHHQFAALNWLASAGLFATTWRNFIAGYTTSVPKARKDGPLQHKS